MITVSRDDMLTQDQFFNRRAVIGELIDGRTYTFYCRARNSIGISTWSPRTDCRAGTCPSAPQDVVTDLSVDYRNVIISWRSPANNGGWAINGY